MSFFSPSHKELHWKSILLYSNDQRYASGEINAHHLILVAESYGKGKTELQIY